MSWPGRFGFGDAAQGHFEAERAELAGVVGDLAADVAECYAIDECHLPQTICHQDPGRCAEGMNGLVNAGRPGGSNARNSLRCQLSPGIGDTDRWETATGAQVAAYSG